MSDHEIRRMAGRCRSGRESAGVLCHAIPAPARAFDRALCGRSPGTRGCGWSEWPGTAVTCCGCLARLAKESIP